MLNFPRSLTILAKPLPQIDWNQFLATFNDELIAVRMKVNGDLGLSRDLAQSVQLKPNRAPASFISAKTAELLQIQKAESLQAFFTIKDDSAILRDATPAVLEFYAVSAVFQLKIANDLAYFKTVRITQLSAIKGRSVSVPPARAADAKGEPPAEKQTVAGPVTTAQNASGLSSAELLAAQKDALLAPPLAAAPLPSTPPQTAVVAKGPQQMSGSR